MKICRGLICICMVCCIACTEESKEEAVTCDESSFITACRSDLTSVRVCENGIVTDKACDSGVCDIDTGKCADPADLCTDADYPASCESDSVRRYCNYRIKATETCAAGTKCSGGQCLPDPDACTAASYPAACDSESVRHYCKNGKKTTETCGGDTKCSGGACITVIDDSCTEADYPAGCDSESVRHYCKNGQKATETCGGDTKCSGGACISVIDDSCSEADYPAGCDSESVRHYCKNGQKTTETCETGTKCSGGACIPDNPGACDDSFVARCENPLTRVYCNNGTIARETCKNGAICNSQLSTVSCRTPVVNDKCDPNAYSEMCYGNNIARICDENTLKVIDVNCPDEYGRGSQCDIRENFYGVGLNAVMCFSDEDECGFEGETEYSYCYSDDETGYRSYYKKTFTCTEFNLGFHFYNSDIEQCPASDPKCGQNNIRNRCEE